ncbi:MAG: hypothetical protein AAFR78_06035, partial [Planctomycetota bacterium]
ARLNLAVDLKISVGATRHQPQGQVNAQRPMEKIRENDAKKCPKALTTKPLSLDPRTFFASFPLIFSMGRCALT